jgi:hypothetical protein
MQIFCHGGNRGGMAGRSPATSASASDEGEDLTNAARGRNSVQVTQERHLQLRLCFQVGDASIPLATPLA